MKDFLTIGGETYRCECNWNAISDFLEVRKYNLSDLARLSDMTPKDINTLLWCSLFEGERLEGREFKKDILDVGAELTAGDVAKFIDIFARHYAGQMGATTKDSEPADGKKKV